MVPATNSTCQVYPSSTMAEPSSKCTNETSPVPDGGSTYMPFTPNQVSFMRQFKALLVRNYLIKFRRLQQTLFEIVFPMFVLVYLNLNQEKTNVFEAIKSPVVDASLYWNASAPLPSNLKWVRLFVSTWFIINNGNTLNKTQLDHFTTLISDSSKHFYPQLNNPIRFNTTFESDHQFELFYANTNESVGLAISLDAYNQNTFRYSIRMPHNDVPDGPSLTGKLTECQNKTLSQLSDCTPYKYYTSIFCSVQAIIDSSIMNFVNSSAKAQYLVPNVRIGTFPQPKLVDTSSMIIQMMPFFLSLSFLPYLTIVPVLLVMEKEKRIKEAMFMMGLKPSAYWLSWMVVEGAISMVACITLSAAIYFLNTINNINPFLLYMLLQSYAFSFILIGFLISPFFKKIKLASACGSFLGIIISTMYMGLNYLNLSMLSIKFLSILSPLAFTFSIKSLVHSYEYISFSNMFSVLDYPVGLALVIIIFDCFVYIGLTIGLDFLFTNDIGLSKLWRRKDYPLRTMSNEFNMSQTDFCQSDNEQVSKDMINKNAIQIQNVTKTFSKNIVAVNNVSLDLYESQITAILGQNGAGKTTLIHMLTGGLTVTDGQISMYGLDVQNGFNLNMLRTKFGVCLQEDILFDELSAYEHLIFFGKMKGLYDDEVKDEISRLLEQVDLTDQKHVRASKLSGGQKRKLCIAIALIGNSTIIFLDEPTSGIDAYSRQRIWSLLQSYKLNRVIILTTHFMDEADILSDRKAIMVNGKIRCVGSSLFLKNRYGVGYHLRVDIDGNNAEMEAIQHLILDSVSTASLDRVTNSEMLFTLPRNQTKNFPFLFNSIDKSIAGQQQGIKGYGITLTTLEDVFLKITDENYYESHKEHKDEGQSTKEINIPKLDEIEFRPTFWHKFKAFTKIRFLLFIRNWSFMLSILSHPFILMIIFYVIKTLSVQKSQKIALNPGVYSDKSLLYTVNGGNSGVNTSLDKLSQYYEPIIEVENFDLHTMDSRHYAVSFESEIKLNKSTELVMIFNKTYYHSLPILQNALTNMLLSQWGISRGTSFKIEVTNFPLPNLDTSSQTFSNWTYIFLLQVILATLPAIIAVEVVEDRNEKIKNYMQTCGMRFSDYWYTTWFVHSTIFGIISLMLIIFSTAIFSVSFITSDPNALLCYVTFFIFYVPTSILVCYVLSHFFDKKDTAQSVLSQLCIWISIIMFVIGIILKSKNEKYSYILNLFTFLWPFYTPINCCYSIFMVSLRIHVENMFDVNDVSYYDWDQNILKNYVALTIHMVICLILLPILDQRKSQNKSINLKFWKKSSTVINEDIITDNDVQEEKSKVSRLFSELDQKKSPLLLIKDLTKVYDNKVAVNSMNLAVESGHIFGLLGANGAGKTTTMRIIIRDEIETSGLLAIEGKVIGNNSSPINASYCPQHNPFWPDITLMEYLKLFCAIRGVVPKQINELCTSLLGVFKIEEHRDKKFSCLSGGTKRKLCLLIAIMTNTKLTLLDEPSTGMDPKSKRFMWNVIISAFEPHGKKSAILTTHSMEEAEALCTKLLIMAKGSVKCLGTIQHLNNKYGSGYILEVKWADNSSYIEVREDVINFAKKLFPNMKIEEKTKHEMYNRIKINVPQSDVRSFALIFEQLEKLLQENTNIEEYGFCQSSIEQVFVEFSKSQHN